MSDEGRKRVGVIGENDEPIASLLRDSPFDLNELVATVRRLCPAHDPAPS